MQTPGKVYLVGAGPGHPELLTIKAANLLKTADVVIYDRLIQQEVLALAKPNAERIYMGKPVDRHDSRQDEVNELLVRKAREGRMVVRLKGGDPFLFGRGGEEAEFLALHGIPFEVIPGVSSCISAPLSAGISVTHREYSSAVAIVTGHQCKDDHLDWAALSRIDTLVVLMGVHNAGEIATRLIAAGRSPETPVAAIQMAFWHGEQVVIATLATLAESIREHQVQAPSTLVIGEVVRMRDRLTSLQRDLARRSESNARFSPGPCADELFHLATGGLATQLLAWALSAKLFDRLEHPRPTCDLAAELQVNADALNDVLEVFVALGLIESSRTGYRNLEQASLYLIDGGSCSLRPALMYEAELIGGFAAIEQFVRTGAKSPAAVDPALHASAAAAAARFAAPAVMVNLQLSEVKNVLVIGWSGDAYARAIRHACPGAKVALNDGTGVLDHDFDLVLISALLGCDSRQRGEQLIERAALATCAGGVLAIHDDLISCGAAVPSDVALARLARRIANGGSAKWSVEQIQSVLGRFGMQTESIAIPSAGILVTARTATATQRVDHCCAHAATSAH